MRGTKPPKSDPERILADPRWNALVTRDKTADGSFFYSVRSTGVFCRPSCAARLAKPENVAFHATSGDAERAGFRPCKRCKPDQPPTEQRVAALMAAACRTIEDAEDLPNLAALAGAAGLSPSHFHRVFKAVVGVTPKAYGEARRTARVQSELADGASVTAAFYGAGFGSSSRFYDKAPAMLGMAPSRYRRGGMGATIRFAVGESRLGAVLVAASESGICAILLGDDPEELLQDLQNRFPSADFVGGDDRFEQLVARVVGFVEQPHTDLDLPLDIQGTAFQQRVWQALRAIPAGSTASYAEIARAIGDAGAARAVAGACAANPLAVAIPCHRVVRSDGALSGYRWGIERKRQLLESEAA
ncbi:bifunctional DNA-binding transcriptional regulator/O6-methylguanine-DNA methyltransferase Ada [Qipengyuania qiaonensis]|uniref:Bifunctional DNA-binding transcriptional regulator/O6-methylguanine-DNA methyltransferase Ada n=1 Tax=Qipengyuania qiaonensis TaxID=2867240 RepID=A0ABS7JCG5_9SPHN|nr:bifunctional DNA-binding transcriptional regulator/O6-methylguanine-DNA methyltransferase Ada [Qipengyuania qiaonensis]MBX7484021.1 bifunctional DNA-binding transcriptional regulator/O6-methylguanine-DNA methyltransferase Ada [Qipengyuania qiaonensis]